MKLFTIPLGAIKANCYVLVDEASNTAAVIDPGDFNKELIGLLKSKDIKNVKYILLTHGHFDHILGAYDLKEYTGAQVAIHELDAPCLFDENVSLAYQMGGFIQKKLKPDFMLTDDMIISIGVTELKVMHTPGHTKGGVCFLCEKEKCIFTGDTLFCHTIGRTDFPGGDLSELLLSVRKLVELEGDYTVYPGHNMQTTLSEERLHNRYVRIKK